jgi:hypothetical protein
VAEALWHSPGPNGNAAAKTARAEARNKATAPARFGNRCEAGSGVDSTGTTVSKSNEEGAGRPRQIDRTPGLVIEPIQVENIRYETRGSCCAFTTRGRKPLRHRRRNLDI